MDDARQANTVVRQYSWRCYVPAAERQPSEKKGTELLFILGQSGVRPNGNAPSKIAEQADQVLSKIIASLQAQELKPADIIKVTRLFVEVKAIAAKQKRSTAKMPPNPSLNRIRS